MKRKLNNPRLTEVSVATQFKPGHKPEGHRRPSRIKAFIKDNKISADDIAAAIKTLIDMPIDELRNVSEDQDAAVLLRAFANAIIVDGKKGGLTNLEILLNRSIGKVTEKVEHSGGITTTTLTKEERDAEIAVLLAKKRAAEKT